ncbi:unnamed protein product [Cylindrotheca closterium]|uniref:Uncharacterized protein n=1 Tax=Cylindrotheca closterium TaxID=2856 RepID=A0AAD2G7W3_9STRA|nr:unnamed protein product [Cylindrotheca closterium]
MRLPNNNRSSLQKTPVTPRSFVSPTIVAGSSSRSSSGWQEKQKLHNKLVKKWSERLPLEGDDEEPSSSSGSLRSLRPSFFQDHDSVVDSLWDSKTFIDYIDDEDDIAASFFRCENNPSNKNGCNPRPSLRPDGVSSPMALSLTDTDRSGMRKHLQKQWSGHNFAALLLEDDD